MTATAPRNVEALQALGEIFRAITTANGYHTDAGARVAFYQWSASDELPRIHITPGEGTGDQSKAPGGVVRWTREVLIEGIADASDDPLAGEWLLDDLNNALAHWRATEYPGVHLIDAQSSTVEVAPRDSGGKTIGARFTLTITYQTQARAA